MFITELLTVLTALLVIIYTFFQWSFQYWKRKNVVFAPPKFPLGNSQGLFSRYQNEGIRLKKFYDDFKKQGAIYGGIYQLNRPMLLLTDLEIIKMILIKDFESFPNRPTIYDEKNDPLSGHLFNYHGTKWRSLRTKLTPTFTSGKIKMMFETIVKCTEPMVDEVAKTLTEPISIKSLFERFTCDVIGSTAFGLECNSFINPNSPFRSNSQKIFQLPPKLYFIRFFPAIAKALKLKMIPEEASDFFLKIVRKTIDYRKENQIKRNDFLQLLIDLENELDFNDIAAQSFLFFVAGFETTATTLTFALYCLAKNPHVQEKLRIEINRKLKETNDEITYDVINEMKYLSLVIDETLRMYPPGSMVSRKCDREYKIPGTDLIIPKGLIVIVPIYAIHHDEEFYPDAEKFDPDRFSEENKRNRHLCSFLPFGEGPRNCIGSRFGLIEAKIGLISLLKNYRFSVNSKTQEPLKFSPNSIVLTTADDAVWLNADKI